MTQKAIQTAIQRWLLTLVTETKEKLLILKLTTETIHKKYWSTGSSQRSYQFQSNRLTIQFQRMLQEVHCKILSKEIITDAARSAVSVFRNRADIIRNCTDRTTQQDRNTAIGPIRLDYPVRIGGRTTGSPRRTGSQFIISLRGSIDPQWSRYFQPLDTSIIVIYSKQRNPAPT